MWRTADGRFLVVSPTAYFLLSQQAAGVPPHHLARRLGARVGRRVTVPEVETAIAKLEQRVKPAEGRPDPRKPFGLWWKLRLLPPSAVARLGRVLAPLLNPVVVVALGAVFAYLASDLGALAGSGHGLMNSGPSVWPALGLILLSSLAHEAGHTTASIRYGAPAGEIGFGLYLVYPVFYSDVSAAWTLSRRRRVVVDIAGVYFQLLFVACYLLVFRFTGWEVARLAGMGALLLAVFALVPIFKFDGYWLLSDGLGVPNLSGQVRRSARHVRDRVLRRPVERLPWPGWVSCVVVVYGVFSIAFIGYFLVGLVPSAAELAVSYPARIAGLVRDLSIPPHRPATGRLHSIFFPGFVLAGVGFALFNLGRALLKPLRRKIREIRRQHEKAYAGPVPAGGRAGGADADRLPAALAGVTGGDDRQLLGQPRSRRGGAWPAYGHDRARRSGTQPGRPGTGDAVDEYDWFGNRSHKGG
jgi:putative peptide zinc metalloprotease protein